MQLFACLTSPPLHSTTVSMPRGQCTFMEVTTRTVIRYYVPLEMKVSSHLVNSHFVNSHFVNSHFVNSTLVIPTLSTPTSATLTKWELTNWELTKWELTKREYVVEF